MYSKFASGHEYARANGYKGSYAEYIARLYDGYCKNCSNCGIKPMRKQEWFDKQ